MPLDAICISALTAELQSRIVGGRIDRVQQPERDMLIFSLRANGENLRLLLAAGTGNARVHVTQANFENPTEPPMFCMLMRKHPKPFFTAVAGAPPYSSHEELW